ncbi:MAG: RNA repair transcriptional activator RtcR family protein [Thermodesulfobacteriota bacterium]
MEKVLLTFTGFQDPYSVGLVGEAEQPGPILTLLRARPFDRIVLFSTPRTEKNTSATVKAIKKGYPTSTLQVIDLPLGDPTDYLAILSGLRSHLPEITDGHEDSRYFISVSSGTPQMHACWVLLAACGEIPGRILNVRPPRFVTRERPVVFEADFTSPEFPSVRARECRSEESPEATPDIHSAVQKLGIVGDHPSTRKALDTIYSLAPSTAPILILGETGTGKELFARLIHTLSGRPGDRFVPLNCAAIPTELVESLLFGHKKGSFTGAVRDETGKFHQADGGTLFLDEIGELPISMQAKLLRVLEDGLVDPIGSNKPHKVDVRVVAATNQDLAKAIKKGHFRQDLYYRLAVGEIRLPPLRERRSDIPKIALHILDRINGTLRNPKRLTPEALSRLAAHSWPGNVRDLENVLERSARLSRHDVLDASDLMITEPVGYADPLAGLPEPAEGFSLEEYLMGARKQLMLRALELAGGNQSEAARLLGVTPQAVHKFLKKA